MSVQAKLIIFLLPFVLHSVQATGYFTYDDCSEQCKLNTLSCTIRSVSINNPINTNDFLIECFESSLKCKYTASDWVVCLRPTLPPLGGEILWPIYARTHKTPECPKPIPVSFINTPELRFSLIANAIQFSLLLIIAGIFVYRVTSSRNQFQQLSENSTDSLPESPEFPPNPYQATISTIE